MLSTLENPYTKEEEIQLGFLVQEGLKAEKELEEYVDLTDDEVASLNKTIEVGRDAHLKLFNATRGIVNRIAHNVSERSQVNYSIEDIAQDGYLALWEAINRYDPTRDNRVSTFVYWSITKWVSYHLNRMRIVRLPENRMEQLQKINKAKKEYKDLYGDATPDLVEKYVLNKTGLTHEVYVMIQDAMYPTKSLDAPTLKGDKNSGHLGNYLKLGKVSIVPTIESAELLKVLNTLTLSEQRAILVSYSLNDDGVSYEEYLRENNLTPDELEKLVRRILRRTKMKLKKEQEQTGKV